MKTCNDCIHRYVCCWIEGAEPSFANKCRDFMLEKRGHWISIDEKSAICSCCNRNNTMYGDFCKWCGARMVDQQESEKV